ncbi:MAG: PBSX family phage terminase large subunit [Clostridiales bacterium]|nr:PBSX family phage terminase large subunit [Clostridiales bacterium]
MANKITINGFGNLLLPHFRPYLDDYSFRYEIYYGGAGSGKSENNSLKVIKKALAFTGRRILILRKVGRTVRTSTFSVYRRLFADHFPQLVKSINKTNMTIELINGSTLLFGGLDDPEKIKSIDSIHDVVMEEANQFNADDFGQINLRLRAPAPNLQIFILFNPVTRQNWVYREFFDADIEKYMSRHKVYTNREKKVFIHHSNYKNNPILSKNYVEEIERFITTNLNYYKIYALGGWGSLGKLVFENNWRLATKEDIPQGVKGRGLDFGFNDPTAYIEGQYDRRNKRIYIDKEYKKSEMSHKDMAQMLTNLGVRKTVDEIIADSEDTAAISYLDEEGFYITKATKGAGSVLAGLKFLMEHEIIVSPECVELEAELQNYEWRHMPKIDAYIDEPAPHQDDHLIDALRYMVEDNMKSAQTGVYNARMVAPYIVK